MMKKVLFLFLSVAIFGGIHGQDSTYHEVRFNLLSINYHNFNQSNFILTYERSLTKISSLSIALAYNNNDLFSVGSDIIGPPMALFLLKSFQTEQAFNIYSLKNSNFHKFGFSFIHTIQKSFGGNDEFDHYFETYYPGEKPFVYDWDLGLGCKLLYKFRLWNHFTIQPEFSYFLVYSDVIRSIRNDNLYFSYHGYLRLFIGYNF